MGMFDTTLLLMGLTARAAGGVTMWTANAVHTAIQNARTKKEVQNICQSVAESNYAARNVLAAPDVDKQMLLLESSRGGEEDVYRLDGATNDSALGFVWGESDRPENEIVSGGTARDRALALVPFVRKAQLERLPVIVLHSGDRELVSRLEREAPLLDDMSLTGNAYEPFRGMSVEDAVDVLYDAMGMWQGIGTISPNAASMLRALVELDLASNGTLTIAGLAGIQAHSAQTLADRLLSRGQLTHDEHAEIASCVMAGASETYSVGRFLQDVARQFEPLYGKSVRSRWGNIRLCLNRGGIAAIDVGAPIRSGVLAVAVSHVRHLANRGTSFGIVVDGIPLSGDDTLLLLLDGLPFSVSEPDFIASTQGDRMAGDATFVRLAGAAAAIVLFRHQSGTSASRWSSHIGTYNKIRVRYNVSQTKAFLDSHDSRGISVDEKEEPRVRAETITTLGESQACVLRDGQVLVARVNEPSV